MHILCLTMIRMRFGIGPDPEHVASTATGSTACYLFVQIFVQDPGGLDKQSAILQNIHGPLIGILSNLHDFKGRFFSSARKNPGFWSHGPAARRPAAGAGVWGPQAPRKF